MGKYMSKLKKIITTFILAGFLFNNPDGNAGNYPEELRAVKLTNVDSDVLYSDSNIAKAMDYLASIGINTILTVVWNSHAANGDYTLYPSQIMQQYFGESYVIHPSFSNRDPLQRVIIEAHRNGMEVLPWFEMGFSTSYSQEGGYILEKYPDWALRDVNGHLLVKNGFDWMSAVNPEVQDFMLALATEVAENYDIDGIEYSDRIPALPVEGGYDSATSAMYQAEHDGALPPSDYRDTDWMSWRAGKLSDWFSRVRDSVKERDPNITISSSPNAYPWAYDEYLQDSKTWMERGIADNLIPQFYRKTYSDYVYELEKGLSYFPAFGQVFFSGMFIYQKNPYYLITTSLLLECLVANRQNNVMGEAFFFYEGFRLNPELGDTLRATFYKQPAVAPGRSGNIWRPKAIIVNEDDSSAIISGSWKVSSISGFKPKILLRSDGGYASITYYFSVPFTAWFDIFAYNVTGPLAAKQAGYTIYSGDDSVKFALDQTNILKSGWQQLTTVYLEKGHQKVIKLDTDNIPENEKLTADATMIMINRKKSPEVLVSPIIQTDPSSITPSVSCRLLPNYPNPFNSSTTFRVELNQPAHITLTISDILGRKVCTLIDEKRYTGDISLSWHSDGLSSGVYFATLNAGKIVSSRKLILIK